MQYQTINDIARDSGIPVKRWHWLGYNANGLYETWDIPKRNGSKRPIASPEAVLREAQSYIKTTILDPMPISTYAQAYAKGTNTAGATSYHIGKPLVIKADISDFFASTDLASVKRVFTEANIDEQASRVLARVCLFRGGLAQGAITSPSLSNLVMTIADSSLAAITDSFGRGQYSRYSDDMTFSFNRDMSQRAVQRFIGLVESVLSRNGYMLNAAKTTVMRNANGRQSVLGIVLNHHRTLPRQWKHNLRAGLYSTRLDYENGNIDAGEYEYLMRSLIGRYYYAKSIDPAYASKLLETYPFISERGMSDVSEND